MFIIFSLTIILVIQFHKHFIDTINIIISSGKLNEDLKHRARD